MIDTVLLLCAEANVNKTSLWPGFAYGTVDDKFTYASLVYSYGNNKFALALFLLCQSI